MPFEWNAPLGAGGNGRKHWVAPKVSGGEGRGGFVQPERQSVVMPGSPGNKEVSREVIQAPNWNQGAVDATGDKTAGFSPFAGPMSPQETVRARLLEAKNTAAWQGDQARKTQQANLLAQEELQRNAAGLKAPAPKDPAASAFFKTHKDYLEDVIKQGGLDPQAAAHLREGFARQDPEIYQVYGPAFQAAATQKQNQPGILGQVANVVTAIPRAVGKAIENKEAAFAAPSSPNLSPDYQPPQPVPGWPPTATPSTPPQNPWAGVGPAAKYVFGSGQRKPETE
jgi:hypothetical protein